MRHNTHDVFLTFFNFFETNQLKTFGIYFNHLLYFCEGNLTGHWAISFYAKTFMLILSNKINNCKPSLPAFVNGGAKNSNFVKFLCPNIVAFLLSYWFCHLLCSGLTGENTGILLPYQKLHTIWDYPFMVNVSHAIEIS